MTKFSNFDPPYHEYIAKATADDLAKYINDLMGNDYSFIICLNPDGVIEFCTLPKAIESGRFDIYAILNSDSGREALGRVIEFESLKNTEKSTVKIRATCLSENEHIINYFENFWQALVSFFPGGQDAGTEQDALTAGPEAQEMGYEAILRKINFVDTTGWDRDLMQLWNENQSNRYISSVVHVTPLRVTNRISELRRKLGKDGEKVLPYRMARKKQSIKS